MCWKRIKFQDASELTSDRPISAHYEGWGGRGVTRREAVDRMIAWMVQASERIGHKIVVTVRGRMLRITYLKGSTSDIV